MKPSPAQKWKQIPLASIAEFRNGVNFTKSNFGVGVKIIGVADFQDYTSPNFDTVGEINPMGVVSDKNLLQKGDILFVRSNGNRALIGRSLYVESAPEPMTHSAFTIRLRFTSEGVLPRFYAYLFRTQLVRQKLAAYGGGTNISNLNQRILKRLEVPQPPIEYQRKVALILSTYDALTQNNLRRLEILEAMTQLVFKSWFVDFEPVHAKAERRDTGLPPEVDRLFPDAFEDSELGEIPRGWEVVRIDDLCISIENGGTPRRKERSYWENGKVPWFKTGELTDGPLIASKERITQKGLEESSCKLWDPGTILIALYASPTVGRLGILDLPSASNQACSGIVARAEYGHLFLFHSLLSTRERLQHIATGAAQQNISQQIVRDHKVIAPPASLAYTFQSWAADLYSLQVTIAKQTDKLANIRDLLLPKLISGDVDISNLDVDPGVLDT